MTRLLYYPKIVIPDGVWLRNALLYWDGVSSIVPRGYFERANPHGVELLRFLEGQGQYTPIDPTSDPRLLQDSFDFHQEFLSLAVPVITNRKKLRPSRRETVFMHKDKFSASVLEFCEETDVATKDEDGLYKFDVEIGHLYISLLAKYVALRAGEETIPSTDSAATSASIFNANSDKHSICMNYSIVSALPCPTEGVALEDLIAFKRRRPDELLRFRGALRNFERELSGVTDLREIRAQCSKFANELELGIADIRHALHDSRLDSRASTLKGLVSLRIESPLTAALVVGGVVASIAELPIQWTLASMAVAGSVSIGCELTSAWTKARGITRNSAFAYVYEAQRAGYIRPRVG
jgi:uncharacterized protein DUF6236